MWYRKLVYKTTMHSTKIVHKNVIVLQLHYITKRSLFNSYHSYIVTYVYIILYIAYICKIYNILRINTISYVYITCRVVRRSQTK